MENKNLLKIIGIILLIVILFPVIKHFLFSFFHLGGHHHPMGGGRGFHHFR